MIERATQRRLAGDWRGACEAANVEVDVDLKAVRRVHGRETAERVEDDLQHLVPDLLRWYLPRRSGDGLLRSGAWYPLALFPEGHALVAHPPRWPDRPQRVTLRFEALDAERSGVRDDTLRHVRDRWDSRCTAEILHRCGGTTRLPFFTATGERLAQDALGGEGPEGLVERIVALDDAGRHAAAWAAAGFRLRVLLFDPAWSRDRIDPAVFDHRATPQARNRARGAAVARSLAWLRPMHTTLATDALARIDVRGRCLVLDRSRVRLVPSARGGHVDEQRRRAELDEFGVELAQVPRIPQVLARRPAELSALLTGRLHPDDLHPLVHAALFPARAQARRAETPRLRSAIRVHCNDATHEVVMRDGAVVMPHTPAEIDRERMLAALGGEVQGCVAAHDGWRDPAVRLPRGMRALRDELMLLVRHGDTEAVLAALRGGLDPQVRDDKGRTLLHLLPYLTGTALLPRLLDAGLDLEARAWGGRTPLHCAVEDGTPDLVRMLLAIGADPWARTETQPVQIPARTTRRALAFLREAFRRARFRRP